MILVESWNIPATESMSEVPDGREFHCLQNNLTGRAMADTESPSFEEECVVAFLLRELGEPGMLFESEQAADSKRGNDLSAQLERYICGQVLPVLAPTVYSPFPIMRNRMIGSSSPHRSLHDVRCKICQILVPPDPEWS